MLSTAGAGRIAQRPPPTDLTHPYIVAGQGVPVILQMYPSSSASKCSESRLRCGPGRKPDGGIATEPAFGTSERSRLCCGGATPAPAAKPAAETIPGRAGGKHYSGTPSGERNTPGRNGTISGWPHSPGMFHHRAKIGVGLGRPRGTGLQPGHGGRGPRRRPHRKRTKRPGIISATYGSEEP